MPKFDELDHAAIGSYVADNLTMGAEGRHVAFAIGGDPTKNIYEIASNLLPHSMYLFIHAILNQQQVVDGRKIHCKADFLQNTFQGKPKLAKIAGETAEQKAARIAAMATDVAAKRAAFDNERMRALGVWGTGEDALPDADTALPPPLTTKLRRLMLKAHRENLYCMRSVHLDQHKWLPPVTPSAARSATVEAYFTYISTYTELPGNIRAKTGASIGAMSAYVEYTAGNKNANAEFSSPRWRIVYDWVNARFFLTWHYQPRFFVTSDQSFTVESPWVHISHAGGTNGLAGPATPPTDMASNLPKHIFNKRDIKTVDYWGADD